MIDLGPIPGALGNLSCVRLAVLFGSQARGNARPDSDVDIAIEVAPDTVQNRAAVAQIVTAFAGAPVDLVFLNDAGPHLRFQVARGRLLVEREPRAWPTMKARAMVDWWDWQPTARIMHAGPLARLRARVAADHGS